MMRSRWQGVNAKSNDGGAQMKKRRVEITVEQNWLVIQRGSSASITMCDRCATPSVMLAPEEAATLTGVTARALYRAVEAGRIHFCELQNGARQQLLVCLATAQNLTAVNAESGHTHPLSPSNQQGDR